MPGLTLKRKQGVVFQDESRFRFLVAGRRFGKTYLACVEMMNEAISKVGAQIWYVAPTYRMAEDIAFDTIQQVIPRKFIQKINTVKLLIVLKNGSKIFLKGADKPNNLVGRGLNFLVMDEMAKMKKSVWPLLRPSISDKKGRCLFISTPEGRNHFYELVELYRKRGDSKLFVFSSLEGENIQSEEYKALQEELDPLTFKQEILGNFITRGSMVYHTFSNANIVNRVEYNKWLPVYIGMDFNINPMTAIVIQIEHNKLIVKDEIVINNANTEMMARRIKDRYKNYEVKVYPDPTGRARKTSARFGVTDHSILQDFGFQVVVPQGVYLQRDRYNTVNAAFQNSKDESILYIERHCKNLIKSMENLQYNEQGEVDKSQGWDHISDALGYLVMGVRPLIRNEVKQMRIVGMI